MGETSSGPAAWRPTSCPMRRPRTRSASPKWRTALRFETAPAGGSHGPVDFILKDLQLNEYLRESARLAELVQDKVVAVHPGGGRGVQQAGFMVLTTARRPAILVETGFATNRTDGAFLASSLGQHKIASAIADGVVAYLLEFERKRALAAPAGGGGR